ncbi:MAG: T9SS type A sorting domain-containing protein, partial [Saprospiraceae bacterium]
SGEGSILHTKIGNLMTSVPPILNERVPKNKITVYPNPFNEETVIQTDDTFDHAALYVSTPFGQIVKVLASISGNTITLSRDQLPEGLYFLNLMENYRVIGTAKLVILD